MTKRTVKWFIKVEVEQGPTLTSSGKINSDAIEYVRVELMKEDNKETIVSIQPGELDMIDFMLIKSDKYGNDPKNQLSYRFSEGNKEQDHSESIILDKDHFLTSNELIKLFKKAPKDIKFTNKTTENVVVDVIIARKAVKGG